MTRLALFTTLFICACATSSDDAKSDPPSDDFSTGTDSNDDILDGPTVEATVRILDAMTSGGMEGVSVQNSAGDTETTGANGTATVEVAANSTFEILLEKDGAIDHLLFGPTAEDDFDYVTFMATEVLVDAVLGILGATPDEGTGVVIVGIDYDNLSPAVGASAAISGSHDDPWVLTSGGASFSDTIPAGGMGMVAFSNVQPGDVSVSVTPPAGKECTAFPGGGEMPEAPVEANLVTVVTFHCR